MDWETLYKAKKKSFEELQQNGEHKMEEMIKRILTNEIVYVPEKDIESCVKSVFGGCAADLLMELIYSE